MSDRDPADTPFGPGSPAWSQRLGQLADETPSPRRAALHDLADATRHLVDGLMMTDVDSETLLRTAAAVQALAEPFHGSERRSLHEGYGEAANAGDPHGFFDHSPLLGRANPIAPPIVLRQIDESTMEGRVRFGSAYEGPPGCVHGGFVAAAFDEVLGATQSMSGNPGMTAHLGVDYRSPTPLHVGLVLRGRLQRTEGRKIFTTGTLHAGDRLCARADALFISVDFARFAELRERRAEQDARPRSED